MKQDGCLLEGHTKRIYLTDLPPSSTVDGINNSFAIRLQFIQDTPKIISLLAMPHLYLETRVLSQIMLHLANYSIILSTACPSQTPPSNQSYCFSLLHQPIVLPGARRASLFPASCHSNLTGFSQSLDIP